MTDLLLDTPLDGQQLELANTIRQSAYALLDIINDILDFSKIEAGKVEIEHIEFNLLTIIENCMDLLSFKAKEKKLALVSNVDPEIAPFLIGDPGRIRQVLLNLISNAIKFTDKGSVTVRATLMHKKGRRQRIRFEVQDTGIGIPADKIHILFQPFTQADATITRKYGGTGLGLSICKRLIEIMDGRIGIKSTEGQGTTFWFELALVSSPLSVASKPAGAIAATPGTGNQVAPPVDSKLILLVEDNPVNQRVASMQLERLGYRSHIAENGQLALQALKTRNVNYALVLMDCQMPIMDGFEATRAIRQEEQETGLHLPIIAMTANITPDTREQCLEAGMDDYLAKPIEPKLLQNVISTWLQQPISVQPSTTVPHDTFASMNGFTHLKQMFGDDETVIRELLVIFITSTQPLLEQLAKAINADCAIDIRALCHQIAGAAANLGIEHLHNLARALEKAAHTSNPQEMQSIYEAMQTDFKHLANFVHKDMKKQ